MLMGKNAKNWDQLHSSGMSRGKSTESMMNIFNISTREEKYSSNASECFFIVMLPKEFL
jgi:hypothetical protein